MKSEKIPRWPSLIALVAIGGGVSFWLFRPVDIPTSAQLRDAASVGGSLLLIAACAGVASMATVQFWKVMFLPRAVFHAAELESVFGKAMVQVLGLAAPTIENTPARSPRPNALNLLLDNPTEIVMGQIRSTADYILLRPKGFDEALHRLAGEAGWAAVDAYLAQRKEEEARAIPGAAQDNTGRSNDSLVEARFFVEQHLNFIHVKLRDGWRWRVRALAVVVAGLTGLLTVILSNLGLAAKISAIVVAMIWGGFFSWLARDLVALIERRRT